MRREKCRVYSGKLTEKKNAWDKTRQGGAGCWCRQSERGGKKEELKVKRGLSGAHAQSNRGRKGGSTSEKQKEGRRRTPQRETQKEREK